MARKTNPPASAAPAQSDDWHNDASATTAETVGEIPANARQVRAPAPPPPPAPAAAPAAAAEVDPNNPAAMLEQIFKGGGLEGVMSQFQGALPGLVGGKVERVLDLKTANRKNLVGFMQDVAAAWAKDPVRTLADLEDWHNELRPIFAFSAEGRAVETLRTLAAPGVVVVTHPLGAAIISPAHGPIAHASFAQALEVAGMLTDTARKILSSINHPRPAAAQPPRPASPPPASPPPAPTWPGSGGL